MKGRFGITGRLVMIALVAVFSLFVFLGILIYQQRTQEGLLQQAFPLPRQVSAMATAIEKTPPADRGLLLRAFNSANVSVLIAPDLPAMQPGTRRLRAVEALFGNMEGLRGHGVRVTAERQSGPIPGLRAWLFGVPLEVAVKLADANYVVIRARGLLFPRVMGVPSGFWLAVFSLIIAGFTLAALIRETRPLRQLTHALERFSQNAVPSPVKPAGASDVRGLIATVNDMQERIGALVKGRTILAGAISHDLKTYLTRLQLRIEELPNAEERSAAENDIASMLAIVDNALSLAKSATDDQHRVLFDLAPVLNEEATRAGGNGRAVHLQTLGDLTLVGDQTGLRRVLVNLIDNAQRYAETLWLTAERDGTEIIVSIEDDGPGIPVEERGAVFEPFYRLDPARSTNTGGSGLGLALSRQIVESHSGRISAEASDHGGAKFRIVLPAAPKKGQAPAAS